MGLIYALLGALMGAWLMSGGRSLFGIVAGLIVGYLLHRLSQAEITIRRLDDRVDSLEQRNRAASQISRAEKSLPTAAPRVSIYEPSPVVPAPEPRPKPEPETNAGLTPEPKPVVHSRIPEPPPRPEMGAHTVEVAKRWLTTGNVPVKVGVIISFFGVAFLLKYAVENEVFSIPMSLRYFAVAGFAAALLAFGWLKRDENRVFALSIQGGGIGVLFLTVFAAFRLHGLLSPGIAFALLILLTVATGVLAIRQESRALAILGTTGGFLAPLLASTGSGNHVALFTYYLILNAAVLGVAWYRPWRELNIIGFVFTFGIGTIWGYQYYEPALFATTEPFLVLYFLFYNAIAVLFAFRAPPKLRGYVDGTLLFGTPTIAFALQTQLLGDTEYGLAISAAIVAAFYAILALWLRRRQGSSFSLLAQTFTALAVAFATVAIPLALDDRWTAIAWAMEGAALVWIGVRQTTTLAKLTGAALSFTGGYAFFDYGWDNNLGFPVLNGNFLGGALIAVTALYSSRMLHTDPDRRDWQNFAAIGLLLWGVLWWFGSGFAEIFDRVPSSTQLHAALIFSAVSFSGIAFAGRHFGWPAYARVSLGLLPVLFVTAILYLIEHEHFFDGLGTPGWIVAIVAHVWILYAYKANDSRLQFVWHAAGAMFFAAVFAFEVYWQIDRLVNNDVWSVAAGLLVFAAGALVLLLEAGGRRWPFDDHADAYLAAALMLVVAFVFLVTAITLNGPGSPAPLPYIPLLNPFDVLSIAAVALLAYGLHVQQRDELWGLGGGSISPNIIPGGTALILSTIAVVRAVHHFTGVTWETSALIGSVGVQSTLSIYWAVLGLGGMVIGARRASRGIWMAGAALMIIVVMKLFVIDLGNTGTVARIVSFLGVGVMLLVVGYFSPVPPKRERAET